MSVNHSREISQEKYWLYCHLNYAVLGIIICGLDYQLLNHPSYLLPLTLQSDLYYLAQTKFTYYMKLHAIYHDATIHMEVRVTTLYTVLAELSMRDE